MIWQAESYQQHTAVDQLTQSQFESDHLREKRIQNKTL